MGWGVNQEMSVRHRFFVRPELIQDNRITILGGEALHIRRVLRLKPGDMAVVCDGSPDEYLIRLVTVSQDKVEGEMVSKKRNASESSLDLTLVQALTKGDKMDFVVQKATELGVKRIIPVKTDHTVVRWDQGKEQEKTRRWNRLALEACKQCGRSQPPTVQRIADFSRVLQDVNSIPGIFFYERNKETNLKEVLINHGRTMQELGIAIFIGPEGGFSLSEFEKAVQARLHIVGLGPRILRTETAGLVALALIMYELGDLGGQTG